MPRHEACHSGKRHCARQPRLIFCSPLLFFPIRKYNYKYKYFFKKLKKHKWKHAIKFVFENAFQIKILSKYTSQVLHALGRGRAAVGVACAKIGLAIRSAEAGGTHALVATDLVHA